MSNKVFSCTIKIGDSIRSKLESYRKTNRILLGSFHEDLMKNIEILQGLVETHDNGSNGLPETYHIWVSSWDALYRLKDEELKDLGITRGSLLADKARFERLIYPSLLKAADKCSGLIERMNSIINKLRLQDKKEG